MAGGNPLALRELALVVERGGQIGDRGDAVAGTAGAGVRRGFAGLPAETRTLLLAMAVADGGDHEDVLAVAALVVGPPPRDDVLGPALTAGLVTREPGRASSTRWCARR